MNLRVVISAFLSALIGITSPARAADAVPPRVPWNNTRLFGTPEPPPPFRALPAYPQLKPKHPVAATREPGANRIVYLENYGYDELRGVLRRFGASADVTEAEVLLD